jgi:hypothetical protein
MGDASSFFRNCESDYGHVGSSRAFGALFHIERNPVSFVQGTKTGGVDGTVMYEYIRPVFLLDETKTLAVIKPFYNSVCHAIILQNNNFQRHKLKDDGVFPTAPPTARNVPAFFRGISYRAILGTFFFNSKAKYRFLYIFLLNGKKILFYGLKKLRIEPVFPAASCQVFLK